MNELLDLAVLAGNLASKEILKHYDKFEVYTKQDKSPLTTADIAANDIIMATLEKSGIKICSEESVLRADERMSADSFWLIDPLDGTKEFIAQNGEFCVCIALIKHGRPILSAIAIPVTGEIFYSKGENIVYKNGEILPKISKTPNLFLLGRHGNPIKRYQIAEKFGFEFARVGSAIKFCRLSENKAASYGRFSKCSLWDIAAGDFLVEQSGGITLDLTTGAKPLYNTQSLETNPYISLDRNNIHLLDKIVQAIKEKL